jgi:hypothetical protein
MSDTPKQIDSRFSVTIRPSIASGEQTIETYIVEPEPTVPEPVFEDHKGQTINMELAKTDSEYFSKNRQTVWAKLKHDKNKVQREADAQAKAERKRDTLAAMQRRRQEADARRQEQERQQHERDEQARKKLWRID